jgi:OOP family OmpA-OmpF porin
MKKTNLLTFLFLFIIEISAQNQLVLEDHFDTDKNTFSTNKTGQYENSIQNGHYTIKIKPNSAFWFTNYSDIDPKEDNFSYEATIEQKKGAKSTYYGLVIGLYGDKSEYICFFINNQGEFFITNHYGGKFHNIVDERSSNAIKTKGPQKLKVIREFNICKYFVNDVEIFEDASRSYYGTGYGIQIEKSGEYWVDDVLITKTKKVYNLVDNPIIGRTMENLGPNINTSHTEIAPVISPDGKTFYFVREGDPRNIGSTKQDVWFSNLDQNGNWGYAQNMGFPINNSGSNFVESVTPDNSTVYVGNTYTLFGEQDGKGISMGTKKGNRWTIPQTIYIPGLVNYDNYVDYYPDISNQFIMMAIDNGKTYGHRDIFISFRKSNGSYTLPLNLGPTINTIGDEFGIVLAADGKTLYFNSYGHTNYGSADVFVSKRLDDSWTNWSVPLNLGPEINSDDWEGQITVAADGEYGYISTNHNVPDGSEDIFRFKLGTGSSQPEPVMLIYGRVLDPKTLLPISATIQYYDLATNTLLGTAVSDDITGEYKIILPAGRSYGFYAEKQGFYPVSENIQTDSLGNYSEIHRNLYLSAVDVGDVIRLNNIFFDTDKADLKPESEAELKRLYDFLLSNPSIKIEIAGHTDDRGSDSHNQVLSQARVNSVIAYLLEKGIKTERLIGVGYGESKPVGTNETEEGRAINRRVEFKILSK